MDGYMRQGKSWYSGDGLIRPKVDRKRRVVSLEVEVLNVS